MLEMGLRTKGITGNVLLIVPPEPYLVMNFAHMATMEGLSLRIAFEVTLDDVSSR